MVHWRFILDEDVSWPSNIPVGQNIQFRDERGKVRLVIRHDGMMTITKDYAWDGCTPTIKLFDWGYIGTPDGLTMETTSHSKTYYASLFHDALYQFLDHPDIPYTRKQADQVFLQLMQESSFSLRWPYYGVVRMLGGVYRVIKKGLL